MDFTVTNVLKVFLESLFVGFGILIPIVSLLKTSKLKNLAVKELFILQAVQAIRIGGIFYAVLHLPDVYRVYFQTTSIEGAVARVSYPAQMQLQMFFKPAVYLLLTQLFWIRKLYMKKVALVVFALFLLIIPFWFDISNLLRGYEASYHQPDSGLIWGTIAKRALLNIVVFFFTVFTLMQLGGKLKKIVGDK
jgi:hypothetical protein